MKKIIVFVVLFVLSIAPVYAKMSGEIVAKGGIIASPYLNLDGDIADVDVGFILGAEGYVFPWKSVGLGVGVTHLFDTDVENTAKKMSDTNVYLSVKPRITIDDEISAVYFLGQLGASKAEINIIDDCGTGIYVAGGVGIEAKWLIIEAIYSYNNWAVKADNAKRAALYTLGLNIGYKFSF